MQVPKIDPTNNRLTTEGPGQTIRQKNTSGEALSIIGSAVENIGQAFYKANLLTEQTKAENNYNARMMDIKERAANDPDTSDEKLKAYHDEIAQASTDSADFIKSGGAKQQFGLELQGKSDIAKFQISTNFQKKKLQDLKDNTEIYLQGAQDNYIRTTDPKLKASAIIERNAKIKKLVDVNMLTPAEGKLQMMKLDKDWALAQVNYDISTNPEAARKALAGKEYINVPEEDRVDLMHKAGIAIKQNARDAADQIETAQIQTQANYLSKLAGGQANWMTLADVAKDVRNGAIPEKFATAYADVLEARAKGKQFQPSQDENRNYPQFINAVYQAKDQKELQNAMYSLLLDHKNISQEKMSVLINGALERGKALSLDPKQIDPKQQEIDSAAMAISNMGRRTGMDPQDISEIYQNFNNDIAAGKTPKEALDKGVRANALKKNPALVNIPITGKIMIDRNGNKAMVFPDGHFEEIQSSKK